FNHCVAVVKLSNGQYMPLDPTWVPFNRELWSSAEQQQNYLPGVPEGSDLLLTPVSAPENHFFKLTANTRLLPDGTLEGEVTVNAEGQSDAAVRRPFLQSFVERVGRSLEAELQRVSPQAKLSGYSCRDAKDYQKGPVVLKMKFTIPDYAVAGDGVMICRPFVLSNLYSGVKSFMRINTSKESRDYGFKDSCSRLVELKETMTLPKGYSMDGVSGTGNNVNVDSDIASFSSSVSGADNKVTIDARLSLGKRVYEAGEWSDFRSAVNAYKDLADSEFVFVKK
ncbi:MAG: transglutaminase, partial [Muribaculaceae bacterium]|nr:transglutaminase [Muribaculaceae bacterium]